MEKLGPALKEHYPKQIVQPKNAAGVWQGTQFVQFDCNNLIKLHTYMMLNSKRDKNPPYSPTLSNHDRISRHAKPVLYQPYLYHRAIITLTFLRMGCMGGFISASPAARSASLSLHAVEPTL